MIIIFQEQIKNKEILAVIVLGWNHLDVVGTESSYQKLSSIYDGLQFTANIAFKMLLALV